MWQAKGREAAELGELGELRGRWEREMAARTRLEERYLCW